MVRTTASDVSALSGIVANGHQFMHTFPLPPLKFRTVGFPQYGFKQALRRDLRRPKSDLNVGYSGRLRPARLVRIQAARPTTGFHAPAQWPLAPPAVMLSASLFAYYGHIRASARHRRFLCLCRRPWDGQKVPNLLCLSLIPCRRLYSGGSRTLPASTRLWLGLRPSCRDSATTFSPHTRLRAARLTKRQHSLDAAARNLASPALDRTFTAELACVRSLGRTSAMTT
jgi:hypothetical protein